MEKQLTSDQLKSLDELIRKEQIFPVLSFIRLHLECSLADAQKYRWEREKEIGFVRDHEMKWPEFGKILEVCTKHAPVAIQAMWDGDSDGWILDLEAVVETKEGYSSHRIGSRRGKGGDLRFFNGMKVLPEIVEGTQLGEKIASHFSIPFYFPAKARPEIDQPNWWQQDEGEVCEECKTVFLKMASVIENHFCRYCRALKNREE